MSNDRPTVGNGKICYLEIPAADIKVSSAFYQKIFGWNIRKRGDGAVAFDDGVGEVSGTWVTNRKPITEVGILIYIMVDDAKDIIEKIISNGGEIVQPIGKDYPEITARFRDPAGNILGIFQEQG
jgi:predicted enzyme related to lactoylglutathione lyase